MVKKMAEKKQKKKVGAPAFFKSVQELESRISEYFTNCPDQRDVLVDKKLMKVPCPTITGLCLFLGFCDRQSFYDYEKRGEFSCTMKKARTFIEKEYEILLRNGNCTGAIFALKNLGWRDNLDTKISGDDEKPFALSHTCDKAILDRFFKNYEKGK